MKFGKITHYADFDADEESENQNVLKCNIFHERKTYSSHKNTRLRLDTPQKQLNVLSTPLTITQGYCEKYWHFIKNIFKIISSISSRIYRFIHCYVIVTESQPMYFHNEKNTQVTMCFNKYLLKSMKILQKRSVTYHFMNKMSVGA